MNTTRSTNDRLPIKERALARSLRVPEDGPLDVLKTATALAVRLTFVSQLEAMGYCLGIEEIEVDRLLDLKRQRVVFAHEVGHLLIRRGLVSRGLRSEETLADQFGDEMAAPSDALENRLPITLDQAAEFFGIPPTRAAA